MNADHAFHEKKERNDTDGVLCQSFSGGDIAFRAGGARVKQLQMLDYF